MKADIIVCLIFVMLMGSCEKLGPFIGDTGKIEPQVIPETVKSRAKHFAYRYGISNVCLIEKQQVVYEPFIYLSSMPDSASWRLGKMNRDMNIFCDSVLRDHRELLPKLQVRFDVFFFRPPGTELIGTISFEYKDLTQYPFQN